MIYFSYKKKCGVFFALASAVMDGTRIKASGQNYEDVQDDKEQDIMVDPGGEASKASRASMPTKAKVEEVLDCEKPVNFTFH